MTEASNAGKLIERGHHDKFRGAYAEIDLEPDQIQPAPRIGTQIRTDFIKGMGKRDTQFIMILDIDRVFSAEELAVVRGQESQKQIVDKQPVDKQAADRQLVGAAA